MLLFENSKPRINPNTQQILTNFEVFARELVDMLDQDYALKKKSDIERDTADCGYQ